MLAKKYDGWCQRVAITLEDGRVGIFLGKVFVDQNDHDVSEVAKIDFFEPEKLPDGWPSFQNIDKSDL